jgi:hypothetical protein
MWMMDNATSDLPAANDGTGFIRGEPWIFDGNFIIQAQNTRFRVLRSILMSQSEVFTDVLCLPQGEDAETVNGCAVIVLHDSASDLQHLLKAIFAFAYACLCVRTKP